MAVKGLRPEVLSMEAYVPGKTIEEVRRELGLKKIVKLGSNENPYAPFPAALEAMRSEIEHANRYPDIAFEEIKALLAGIHGTGPGNIAISHGAEGMLQAMGKCFIGPGDEVLLPSATYGLYKEISRLMGAKILEIPMDDRRSIDMEGLRDAVSGRTRLIWLCNPNNPTGSVFDPGALGSILGTIPDSAWVVLDEAYAEFAHPEDLPDRSRLILEGKNLISVRTFSKAYGLAGARLGYGIAREEVITAIDTVSEPFNANRLGIAAGVAVLTKDREACESARLLIVSERERVSSQLRMMGFEVVPSRANFIFFETSRFADEVAGDLLRRGVIVRPCGGWGYEKAIRVTVGTEEENNFFLGALEETFKTSGTAGSGPIARGEDKNGSFR